MIILSFSITFYLLLPNNQLVKDPINLQYFLLVDVILVLFLLSIIIRQIVLVFIYRKNNYDESDVMPFYSESKIKTRYKLMKKLIDDCLYKKLIS